LSTCSYRSLLELSVQMTRAVNMKTMVTYTMTTTTATKVMRNMKMRAWRTDNRQRTPRVLTETLTEVWRCCWTNSLEFTGWL